MRAISLVGGALLGLPALLLLPPPADGFLPPLPPLAPLHAHTTILQSAKPESGAPYGTQERTDTRIPKRQGRAPARQDGEEMSHAVVRVTKREGVRPRGKPSGGGGDDLENLLLQASREGTLLVAIQDNMPAFSSFHYGTAVSLLVKLAEKNRGQGSILGDPITDRLIQEATGRLDSYSCDGLARLLDGLFRLPQGMPKQAIPSLERRLSTFSIPELNRMVLILSRLRTTTIPEWFGAAMVDAVLGSMEGGKTDDVISFLDSMLRKRLMIPMGKLERFRQFVDARLEELEPKRFCLYLNVLARNKYDPSTLKPTTNVYPRWRQRVLDLLPSFEADEMSTATNALGRLLYFPDQAFVDAIVEAAGSMTQWRPQLLANTLYGLCRMECHVPPKSMVPFAQIALAQIQDFNAQDLAMTISALGRLGCHPGDELFNAMRDRFEEIAGDFSSEGLSMSIMGWGLVGYDPGEAFLSKYYTWLMDHLLTFKASDFVEALGGLTRIGSPPPQFLVDAALKVMMDGSMEKVKPAELGVLLHWVTTFKIDPGEDFVRYIIRCMLRRWKELTPTSLATILTGLGRLEAPVSVELLDKMRDLIMQQLKSFNAQEVSNVLTAMSRLRYDPGQMFFEAVCQLVGERIESFSLQGLSNVLNGLAKAGFDPPRRFWAVLSTAGPKLVDDFNLFEACALLWSLVALNSPRSWELVRPLVRIARVHGERALATSQVNLDCARQLKQVILAIKVKGDILPPDEVKGVQKVVDEVWDMFLASKEKHDVLINTSLFQKAVTKVLKELGLSYQEEYDDGVFVYDAVIWPAPDAPPTALPIVFEVDGPSHYLVNSATTCVGDTRFKRWLVRAQQDRWAALVSVSYFEWRLVTQQELSGQELVKRKLLRAGVPLEHYGLGPQGGGGGDKP